MIPFPTYFVGSYHGRSLSFSSTFQAYDWYGVLGIGCDGRTVFGICDHSPERFAEVSVKDCG